MPGFTGAELFRGAAFGVRNSEDFAIDPQDDAVVRDDPAALRSSGVGVAGEGCLSGTYGVHFPGVP